MRRCLNAFSLERGGTGNGKKTPFCKICETFLNFYIYGFTFKALIGLIAMIMCMCLQGQVLESTDLDERRQLLAWIDGIQYFMANIGHGHRASGPIGLFYSCIYVGLTFVLYLPALSAKHNSISHIKKSRLVVFLEDPKREYMKISSSIDECLNQIIESNLNYMRLILRRYIEDHATKIINHSETKNDPMLSKFNRYIDTSCCDIIVCSLTKQLEHLNQLISNKQNVWPSNRNSTSQAETKRIWFLIYLLVSIILWFIAMLCNLGVSICSYYGIMELTNEKVNKVTLLDRIAYADYDIFLYLAVEWFVMLLTVVFISLWDQMKDLRSFETRLHQFCLKIMKLKDINTNKIPHNEIEGFDREYIELYILYLMLRKDIQSPIYLAQWIISRFVTILILSAVPASIFYKRMEGSDLTLFLLSLAFIAIAINSSLICCATLNVTCMRFTNKVWSLISWIEDQTKLRHFESYHKLPRSKFCAPLDLRSSAFCNHDTSCAKQYFEYSSNAIVNPHTQLLWRRLVTLNEITTENFVCKLFGVIRIDYSGILKLNHWLISGLLFTYTQSIVN